MSTSDYQIDSVDRAILGHLLADSRMAFTEIAKKLLVSPGTIHQRMKKMEDAGIVEKATLRMNPGLLGFDIVVFLGLHLSKGSYDQVLGELMKVDEVVEAHYTTGIYGIFMKMVCKNTAHLRDVLKNKIQSIDGIEKTETMISMESGIDRGLSSKTLDLLAQTSEEN